MCVSMWMWMSMLMCMCMHMYVYEHEHVHVHVYSHVIQYGWRQDGYRTGGVEVWTPKPLLPCIQQGDVAHVTIERGKNATTVMTANASINR